MKLPVLNKLSSLQLFQVSRFGAPFVISIILVRLLSQQNIGLYESLTLIGSSFTFFWVTGVINTFIPYLHSKNEAERPKIIFNIFILLSALSLLCFLILLGLKPVLFPSSSILYPNLYYYFLVYNLFNAPAFLMEYLLMLHNRSKTLVAYGVSIFVIQVAAITLPLALGLSLETGILFLASSALLKYSLLSIYVIKIGKTVYSKTILSEFGAKAFPAVLALIVGGSMPYIDSYIALHFVDKAKFAIYRYGAQEMPLVMLMANALSNVFSGEIAGANLNNNIHDSLQKLKTSSKRLMHSLFPLTIILIIFSRYLFTHVYSANFIYSAQIFNVFMLLTISRLIFPQTILIALMKNKVLLTFNSIEWVTNFTLDFVFYYYFGLIGIAYATVFAYFLEKLFEILYLQKMGYNPSDYIPIKEWVLYAAITILAVVLVGVSPV